MHDETRLLHLDRDDEPFRALTTPVHRASTLIFPTVEGFFSRHSRFYDGYSYGLYGHPASRALAHQVAALEDGSRTLIVPSGMAAISRSDEHTSELQSLMRTSYAVFCLKNKINNTVHPPRQ